MPRGLTSIAFCVCRLTRPARSAGHCIAIRYALVSLNVFGLAVGTSPARTISLSSPISNSSEEREETRSEAKTDDQAVAQQPARTGRHSHIQHRPVFRGLASVQIPLDRTTSQTQDSRPIVAEFDSHNGLGAPLLC